MSNLLQIVSEQKLFRQDAHPSARADLCSRHTKNSGPAVRQHPGPGTESLTLDARRLSLSDVRYAELRYTAGIDALLLGAYEREEA